MSGCTQIQERAKQLMWERSGVTEDFSYLQYQQMETADALDENGLYHSAELESYEKRQEKSGTVHVTFARNDFLHFNYYRDEAFSQIESYLISVVRTHASLGEGFAISVIKSFTLFS